MNKKYIQKIEATHLTHLYEYGEHDWTSFSLFRQKKIKMKEMYNRGLTTYVKLCTQLQERHRTPRKSRRAHNHSFQQQQKTTINFNNETNTHDSQSKHTKQQKTCPARRRKRRKKKIHLQPSRSGQFMTSHLCCFKYNA